MTQTVGNLNQLESDCRTAESPEKMQKSVSATPGLGYNYNHVAGKFKSTNASATNTVPHSSANVGLRGGHAQFHQGTNFVNLNLGRQKLSNLNLNQIQTEFEN